MTDYAAHLARTRAASRILDLIAACPDHDLEYGCCGSCGVWQSQIDEMPAHLHPDACDGCGGLRSAHTGQTDHDYWSNVQAAAYFAAEAAGYLGAVYPDGSTSAEERYVNQTRGR